MEFKSNTPCNNCPYRKDAPLAHWHRAEFTKLLDNDKNQFSPIYGCHKKNNSVCVGWLINQRDRGFPCLTLRMKMMREGTTSDWLDTLNCPSEMFTSIEEMVEKNTSDLVVLKARRHR